MPPRKERPILDVRLYLPAARDKASPYASWNLSESAYVRALERYGIRHAVLHPSPSQDADFPSCVRRNRDLLRFAARFPRRFTAACGVDLRFPEESLREIESWKKEFGMVWVSEIAFPGKAEEAAPPALDRILQHIQNLNLIATVSGGAEAAGVMARTHPSATLVFSQLEFALEQYIPRLSAIGGGAFHADTAPRGYERMGLIEMAVERLGGAKVLFASKFSMHSAPAVIARIENAFLDEKQKDAIFAGNAHGLLAKAGWKF